MNCPKCDSKKIQKSPLNSALFLTGGCLLVIPIIGWIISLAIWIVVTIKSFKKGKQVQCVECKYNWYVSKERFKKWEDSISQRSTYS